MRFFSSGSEERERSTRRLTFENRAQVPHGDAAFAHVLADADLQEENRHAARHQADEVRDQKRTWKNHTLIKINNF